MKLEIGKSYLTRDGKIVEIKGYAYSYPFQASDGSDYSIHGEYLVNHETPRDLIAEAKQTGPKWLTVTVPHGTQVRVEHTGKPKPDSDDWGKIKREGGVESSGTAAELGML